jgi:hypothetical protein
MNEYSTHIRIMCVEQRMHQPMLYGSFDFVNNFKFWFFENFQNHKTSRFCLKKNPPKKKRISGFHERTRVLKIFKELMVFMKESAV